MTRDLDYRARAAGREIADDANSVARRARYQAHQAKEEIEDDIHSAANAVGSGLRDAGNTVVGGIVLLEDKIEHGFDRLAAKAHNAAARARAEANKVANDVRDDVQALENKVAKVANDVEKRASYISFANYKAPLFRDVGYDYDATFYQSRTEGKRVCITTPNLLGTSVRGAEWYVSSVHSSADHKANEQLSSNFRWTGQFFNRRPIVRVTNENGAWEFRRPQAVDFNAYACLPAHGNKPTIRAEASVVDRLSSAVFGGSIKLIGQQWVATYRSVLPYVSLAGTVASDGSGEKVSVSGGVASTVFTDALRGSKLNLGVQVNSGKYDLKQTAVPNSVASVTGKVEYDEDNWNVDARVRARNYTTGASQQLKISDAHVRGLYVFKKGPFVYPRTAVGVTVGVATRDATQETTAEAAEEDAPDSTHHPLRFGDPDRRLASNHFFGLGATGKHIATGGIDAPVVGVAVNHAINPQSRVALSLTSLRVFAASFNYALRPDIRLQTSLATELPAFDTIGTKATGLVVNPQLGVSVTIGAF